MKIDMPNKPTLNSVGEYSISWRPWPQEGPKAWVPRGVIRSGNKTWIVSRVKNKKHLFYHAVSDGQMSWEDSLKEATSLLLKSLENVIEFKDSSTPNIEKIDNHILSKKSKTGIKGLFIYWMHPKQSKQPSVIITVNVWNCNLKKSELYHKTVATYYDITEPILKEMFTEMVALRRYIEWKHICSNYDKLNFDEKIPKVFYENPIKLDINLKKLRKESPFKHDPSLLRNDPEEWSLKNLKTGYSGFRISFAKTVYDDVYGMFMIDLQKSNDITDKKIWRKSISFGRIDELNNEGLQEKLEIAFQWYLIIVEARNKNSDIPDFLPSRAKELAQKSAKPVIDLVAVLNVGEGIRLKYKCPTRIEKNIFRKIKAIKKTLL